ncbi:hypothetical protein EYF80_024298 [Liparis tanakae]|uniref:Uncharacterized protein n=1 Tax=Liparis tanakae TaxID=230148 RepID=A0A4Z2HHU1_9TELE|nr:hypothetical protein EYF80_024298 [Liparis tanakae]
MAMVRSYCAAFLPGMEDRKESLMAQAPSTASSKPGRRHTELLLIQPLLNSVSPSAREHEAHSGGDTERRARTVVSRSVQVHLFSEVRQDGRHGSGHPVQHFLQNGLAGSSGQRVLGHVLVDVVHLFGVHGVFARVEALQVAEQELQGVPQLRGLDTAQSA